MMRLEAYPQRHHDKTAMVPKASSGVVLAAGGEGSEFLAPAKGLRGRNSRSCRRRDIHRRSGNAPSGQDRMTGSRSFHGAQERLDVVVVLLGEPLQAFGEILVIAPMRHGLFLLKGAGASVCSLPATSSVLWEISTRAWRPLWYISRRARISGGAQGRDTKAIGRPSWTTSRER